MESIADLLPRARQKSDIVGQVRAALVLRSAQEVLRREVGPGVSARSFRDGVVSVACLSPDESRRVTSRQAELVARLNDRLGGSVVARIRIVG